ncbi:molecular chaperone [Paraherbaspirillum soli]|uniref:Molecular chaperone n=1 Tax=Paraherbaspirillum soli TaxID=631222 RepID=A0ABW0MB12_9BURK
MHKCFMALARGPLPVAAILALTSLLPSAHAGIVVGGTRVVFEGGKRETSISVNNKGDLPYIVQAWVEDADNQPPFLVTPPMSRLEGEKESLLRIICVKCDQLPSDKESVFWLSIKEIPPMVDGDNVLQLAVRTRIKLFYRPRDLKGNVGDAPLQLAWTIGQAADGAATLEVNNPTPYFVSFSKLTATGASGEQNIKARMLAPFGKDSYPLDRGMVATAVSFSTINDYGADVDSPAVPIKSH